MVADACEGVRLEPAGEADELVLRAVQEGGGVAVPSLVLLG